MIEKWKTQAKLQIVTWLQQHGVDETEEKLMLKSYHDLTSLQFRIDMQQHIANALLKMSVTDIEDYIAQVTGRRENLI
jgi:hypothetical protein